MTTSLPPGVGSTPKGSLICVVGPVEWSRPSHSDCFLRFRWWGDSTPGTAVYMPHGEAVDIAFPVCCGPKHLVGAVCLWQWTLTFVRLNLLLHHALCLRTLPFPISLMQYRYLVSGERVTVVLGGGTYSCASPRWKYVVTCYCLAGVILLCLPPPPARCDVIRCYCMGGGLPVGIWPGITVSRCLGPGECLLLLLLLSGWCYEFKRDTVGSPDSISTKDLMEKLINCPLAL